MTSLGYSWGGRNDILRVGTTSRTVTLRTSARGGIPSDETPSFLTV